MLSRKLDEEIMIGPDIVVRVCRIDRGRVRIGITAPRDLAILRPEMLREGKDAEGTQENEVESRHDGR